MKKTQKILALILTFIMVLTMNMSVFGAEIQEQGIVAEQQLEAATDEQASIDVNIKIVHTNDTHGRAYEEQDRAGNTGVKATIAGFDKVKAVANSTDAKYGGKKADFILDAGDIFHGLSFATMDKGESIARIVGAVGYDGISPGNHDWNYGQDRLKNLADTVKATNPEFKMLAGNIEKDGAPFFDAGQSIIKEIDGVTVGVFGFSDPRIKDDVAPYHVEGLTFQEEVAYANQMAADMRKQGCEVVIVVSHGLDLGTFVAQTEGIDVVVAGHEHQVFNIVEENAAGEAVQILETGYYFNNIGLLSLQYNVESGTITATETLVSPQEASGIPLDAEAEAVATLMSQILTEQGKVKNEKVGETSTGLPWGWPDVRIAEQPIGRLITDSYLNISGADIAFENAGGIRAGLQKGDITIGNVIDISPFGNYLETRTMKGSDIRTVLERSLDIGKENKLAYDIDPGGDAYPGNSGSYLQCGGFYAVYDITQEKGKRISSIELVGLDGTKKAFSEAGTYTVVLSNYLATSSEYLEFGQAVKVAEYAACEESIIQYVGKGDAVIQSSVSRARVEALTDTPIPEIETVTIQYVAGVGGSITGNIKQIIECGTDAAAVKAVAGNGYQFLSWSDGIKTAERSDKAVDKDITITAAFEKASVASTDNKTPPQTNTVKSVATGDATPIGSIIIIIMAAGTVLAVLGYKKKSSR